MASRTLSELTVGIEDSFTITFEVNGDVLIGSLYNSEDVLLATIEATNDDYTTGDIGHVGVLAGHGRNRGNVVGADRERNLPGPIRSRLRADGRRLASAREG